MHLRKNFQNDGEKILESKLAVSKDDDTYFDSNKIYTNMTKIASK